MVFIHSLHNNVYLNMIPLKRIISLVYHLFLFNLTMNLIFLQDVNTIIYYYKKLAFGKYSRIVNYDKRFSITSTHCLFKVEIEIMVNFKNTHGESSEQWHKNNV